MKKLWGAQQDVLDETFVEFGWIPEQIEKESDDWISASNHCKTMLVAIKAISCGSHYRCHCSATVVAYQWAIG